MSPAQRDAIRSLRQAAPMYQRSLRDDLEDAARLAAHVLAAIAGLFVVYGLLVWWLL